MRPPRPLFAFFGKPGARLASCHYSAALAALAALLTLTASAQTPDDPGPSSAQDRPYVLHVYTDLLQVPTLVLDSHGAPATKMTRESFGLQIDAGPTFHPTVIHTEGDEPLSINLVLDASGVEAELIKALPLTATHGFPDNLLPHDHIGVYAFDCAILQSNLDNKADFQMAHEGIAHMLVSPLLHKRNAPTKTCRSKKRLWDAVAIAAKSLANQPGRRALLVISDGEDGGSDVPWSALKDYAASQSIAIFVLRGPETASGSFPVGSFGRGGATTMSATFASTDLLGQLTEWSGGIVLEADSRSLADQLDRFVTLLRSRYILQFPRPATETAGFHHLDVKVSDRSVVVRAAGITAPLRDAALMNDPSTVPSDTSKFPVAGKKRPAQ